MALGIYKPGQGYWVRVLTATGIAIITLAAAAWGWKEMAVLADRLPSDRYHMTLATTAAVPAPGEAVTLLGKPESAGAAAPVVGTGVVDRFERENRELFVQGVKKDAAAANLGDTRSVKSAAYEVSVQTGSFRVQPLIATSVLQGVCASVVLLIGAVVAYWFCALKPKTGDFLIATDLEMKKVNWSTWKDIKAQTAVVIGAAVLIAGFLFIVDLAFQGLFRMIDILKT